jgi:Fic family protein
VKPFVPRPLPHHNLQWEPLIPWIGQANRALAHYDGVLYGMPNAAVLLSLLATHEAVLSSKISGARAPLDEVLKFDAGEEPSEETQRGDIQEVENYRKALQVGEQKLAAHPFSLELLLNLHATLLTGVRGRDKGRGRFRTVQIYLGANGTSTERATFIPPEPRRLPELRQLGNFTTTRHGQIRWYNWQWCTHSSSCCIRSWTATADSAAC